MVGIGSTLVDCAKNRAESFPVTSRGIIMEGPAAEVESSSGQQVTVGRAWKGWQGEKPYAPRV